MRHALLSLLASLALGTTALGTTALAEDVIVLRDGTQIVGQVQKVPGGWEVTTGDGAVTQVASPDVASLRFGSGRIDDEARAMQQVERVRRTAQEADDLEAVIADYRRLLEQDLAPAARTAAEADLTWWLGRKEAGAVKYGQRWVTPQERRRLAQEQLASASAVRALIKQSSFEEAHKQLQQALESDPLDVSSHYLLGVVRLRQEDEQGALLAFAQVARLINDHAPTLNNLAVLNFGRGNFAAAREQFEQAIIAAPASRAILDNVAEAMHRLETDGEARTSWLGSTLARRFAEQDALLQTRLAEQGLYRWGSTWLDKAELDRLQAAETGTQERLTALQRDYQITRARIDRLEASIERTQRSMRTIDQQRFVRDADGSYRRLPHPPAYYDMMRDIDRLQTERADEVARLAALRDAGREEQAKLGTARYGRELAFILEDGVPVVLPADQEASPD